MIAKWLKGICTNTTETFNEQNKEKEVCDGSVFKAHRVPRVKCTQPFEYQNEPRDTIMLFSYLGYVHRDCIVSILQSYSDANAVPLENRVAWESHLRVAMFVKKIRALPVSVAFVHENLRGRTTHHVTLTRHLSGPRIRNPNCK